MWILLCRYLIIFLSEKVLMNKASYAVNFGQSFHSAHSKAEYLML